MSEWGPPAWLPVDVVVGHPSVRGLGIDDYDQRRAEAFARDLARWLVGRPAGELGPLARVITVIAGRELRWTRRLCKDRPLLAVEAAARATAALWPWLRQAGPTSEPEDEPEPPPASQGEGGDGDGDETGDDASEVAVGGAGGGSKDEDDGEEASDESDDGGTDGDRAEADDEGESEDGDGWAERLGLDDEDLDDPDLEALLQRLAEMASGQGDEAGESEAAAEALGDVSGAAEGGAQDVDEVARHLEGFLPGVGWSNAPGQLEVALLERLELLTDLLAQMPELQKLADQLGRLEESDRRRGPSEGGSEEVVGVRLGGDVRTALPGELALLGDPETEDLFYQRLIEHRLVSLELAGAGLEGVASGVSKGPIIACIDTSASMEGPRELAAKALVLAVCRSAVPRGRAVHLLLFGGPGEYTELRVGKGLGGLEAILSFLQQRFHSGTDFDGPLLRALELLDERDLERADVLVVTDGLGRPRPEVVQRVAETRTRRGLRVWSVLLGNDDPRGVAPFSDEVLFVDPSDPSAPRLGSLTMRP